MGYCSEKTNARGRRHAPTYREELRLRDGRSVNERFAGGAFGCPGEYFRGAAVRDCREGFRTRCTACWGSPYRGEAWIPEEKRDD